MSQDRVIGTLPNWKAALERPDLPFEGARAERRLEVAAGLYEDLDPYATLEGMGLPTPLYAGFDTAAEFLDNPEPTLQKLTNEGAEKFYVGLRPHPDRSDLVKLRVVGLGANQVVDYVTEKTDRDSRNHYALRIAENATSRYGATMIINASGFVHVELVRGERLELGTGAQSPEFMARSDEFTRVMRYDFEDPKLRRLVWQAISRTGRQPGYYEFSIVDRKRDLVPVFYEYNSSPLNTVPEHTLF